MKIVLCYVLNLLSKLFYMCFGVGVVAWNFELEFAVTEWQLCVMLLLAVLLENLSNLPDWKEQTINRRALIHAIELLAKYPDYCFCNPENYCSESKNVPCEPCVERYLLQEAEKQLKEERAARKPWKKKKQ